MEQLFAFFLLLRSFFPQLGVDFPDLIVQDSFYFLVFSLEQHLWETPMGCLEGLSALCKGSVQADLDIFLSQFSSTAWKPAPITQAGIKLEGKSLHPKMLAGGFRMQMTFGGQSGNALAGAPPFLCVQSLSRPCFCLCLGSFGAGKEGRAQ